MGTEPAPRPESEQLAWEEHNVSQLRYFCSLSLREKMVAVQGMADVVRRFEEMRGRGEFRVASQEAGFVATVASNVREPQATPYGGIATLDFDRSFLLLTGHAPFPWQRSLYNAFFIKGQIPQECDIPTGLGKTATIAVWLLALAHHSHAGVIPTFPRRLVYVVNRRTVVDQATREVEQMRHALTFNPELRLVAGALRALAAHLTDVPLAISTLRGQFADNAEWRDDPARAAVVVGTVDMIGSRLLFSGYGRGFKSRPLHAAFLGQDTLLVHDEAHLEPAFQDLVTAIESEQHRSNEFRRVRVMALSATSRGDGAQFGLTEADMKHDVVGRRISARKGISFHSVDDQKNVPDQVATRALKHEDSGQAILVFLRKLEDVEKVTSKLPQGRVQTLTGTMRGLERDSLAKEDTIFSRFMPKPEVLPQQGTVYLVCTSAGEVGVNISADHLVCDLTPFDSMAQRFGRVNRFGDGDARLDVIHCTPPNFNPNSKNEAASDVKSKKKAKPPSSFDQACERTLLLLQKLQEREDRCRDASPAALGVLPIADRQAAFTPPPVIVPASDILFDGWALTSIRQKLPGRPPVADWLHGLAEWEAPETLVAWREEVGNLNDEMLGRYKPEDLLDDYPLKPQELLRDRSDRVLGHLKKLAETHADRRVWLVAGGESVIVMSLGKLAEGNEKVLNGCTVLLPPGAGGLLDSGMLSGTAAFHEHRDYDVADCWMDENENPRRLRVWDDHAAPDGMRLVRLIDTRPDADDEKDEDEQSASRRYWRWYVRPRSADDDGSRTARRPQELASHLQSAEGFASALVAKLVSESDEARAVTLAAKWHDLGKRRVVWQRSIGNHDPNLVLAKSGGRMRPLDITDYRHEFGSLIDVGSDAEFRQLTPEMRDLVLHLIAAHHGRARPHFPADEAFDPEHSDQCAAEIAREVPRRYARLQRKYGRWGLAYLESLVRAADALASQNDDPESQREGSPGAMIKKEVR